LPKIIEFAQWSPPAFLRYVDCNALERQAVIDAHADESSSESDEDSAEQPIVIGG